MTDMWAHAANIIIVGMILFQLDQQNTYTGTGTYKK